MIGVTFAPVTAMRSRHASCSSGGEAQATWWTVPVEAFRQEVDRLVGYDSPLDRVHHPGARASLPRPGVLEERDVGARIALLVGVEEVVDGRIVLVDGLLDEPEAERPRVELDIARRVGRDRRDVMDPFELHAGF